MTADAAKALGVLLEDERALLLSGDIAAVSALTVRKTELVSELTEAAKAGQARDLAHVDQALRRNSELIEQSLAGIRKAAALFRNRRMGASMRVYSSAGATEELSKNSTGSFEKSV